MSLTDVCLVFFQLRRSYGNIYSLFIGPKPAVVLNGVNAIKEALVTKANDFSGRPQDMFINDATQRKGRRDMIRHIMYNQIYHHKKSQCSLSFYCLYKTIHGKDYSSPENLMQGQV